MPRKFVIGDIRGELDLLKALLDKIQPAPEDVLLFLGSYLGPGKDSRGTLDYLIALKSRFPQTMFLKGCYEVVFQMFLTTWNDKSFDPEGFVGKLWRSMDGDKVLQSYASGNGPVKVRTEDNKVVALDMDFKIPEAHIRFLEQELHQWYLDHDLPFVASHAGFNPRNFSNPTIEETTFGVNGWWEGNFHLPETRIVFSHVPFKVPFVKDGKIGIDLGAGVGGKLCAVEFPGERFHIVGS